VVSRGKRPSCNAKKTVRVREGGKVVGKSWRRKKKPGKKKGAKKKNDGGKKKKKNPSPPRQGDDQLPGRRGASLILFGS